MSPWFEKVRTANVPVYLNGVGTVQAFNTATVRTQVSGRLIDVPYTEGQEVKEGDVLAMIDPALYQAAYDQAVAQKAKDEALLANARLDEKRYADLVKTNAATQQQADTAKWTTLQDVAQVNLDQALIDNARANLQWATIKAPRLGRTGIRLVDKGNLVTSGDATGIVIITQLRPIAVVFTLPENTVGDVLDASAQAPVQLQAVTGNKVIGEGKLLVIDNQIDNDWDVQNKGHVSERAKPLVARPVRQRETEAQDTPERHGRSLSCRAAGRKQQLCLSCHARKHRKNSARHRRARG